MLKPFILLILYFIASLLFSCTSVTYRANIENYLDEISKLKQEIGKNKNNAKALRDLGIIYFRTAKYSQANEYLQKAYQIDPDDPQTIFYYGMSLEFLQERDKALPIYAHYPKVSILSAFRSKIEGRYHWLSRLKIREEMKALIGQEDQLDISRLSTQKIAVFPFFIEGDDPQFAALGRGLSEMIITDLSQINELQLVERIRIEALLEEMALGYTGLIEQSSAPRFGKLLGAGKIIHGKVAVLAKNTLRLDASYWDIINKQFPKFASHSDALEHLFKMEKDIVFKVIDEMGIELTQEERERIQLIPTKNMQAFIFYCMGLELQDGGNFKAAAMQYEKAGRLDPDFTQAKTKAQTSVNMDLAAGSVEQFAANMGVAPTTELPSRDLVTDRLHKLNINMGSNFMPGIDSRQPDKESSSAGADIGLEDLPDPPRPPGRN